MTYTFHDFPEAAYGDGFGYPTDVKYGSVYLGTLINLANGIVIKYVDTPDGKKSIKPGGTNRFKTQQDASETLHKTWAFLRRGQD